jgi:dTDP-glucose 4,6-dehydratase
MKNKTYAVTGGCGFIGSNFVHYLMEGTDSDVLVIDSMTYASNIDNIEDLLVATSGRCNHTSTDIRIRKNLEHVFTGNDIDTIFHFAAESHVDNSIDGPEVFVDTNVKGTFNLLEMAKEHNCKFVHISTDEVYGDLQLDDPAFTENTPLDPSSVYSASKAASDMLVNSYNRTYGVHTITTRCVNNYGPRQHREKLVPKVISNALNDIPIPVYGLGENIREWIHVMDHCSGIYTAYTQGSSGETYNIGSGVEMTNIDLVKAILKKTGKPEDLIEFVTDRQGHDFRYAIDSTKIRNLGWTPSYDTFNLFLDEGLEETINWYK